MPLGRKWMVDPATHPGERPRLILRPRLEYEGGGTPTLLDGITYRSKVEARWAAFFGAARLDVAYEPYRVSGWLPDFVWTTTSGIRHVMEVKPLVCIEHWRDFDYLPKTLGENDRLILLGQGILDGHKVLHDHLGRSRKRSLQRKTIEARHKRLQLGWKWSPVTKSWEGWFPPQTGIYGIYRAWVRAQWRVSLDDHFIITNRIVCSHDQAELAAQAEAERDAARRRDFASSIQGPPLPRACRYCRRRELGALTLRSVRIDVTAGGQPHRMWEKCCDDCIAARYPDETQT